MSRVNKRRSWSNGLGVVLAGSALFVIGCATAQAVSDGPTPVQRQMHEHFRHALQMRSGAIFGDSELFIEASEALASMPETEGLPPGSERFVSDLRRQAEQAATASDAGERRTAGAEVARTCGACHQAYRVGPEFVIGGPLPGESLQMHMARQARVSRLLWDGLVGPSNSTWEEGAEALESTPEFPREIVSRVRDAELLEEARSQLQALGARASQATDPSERVRLLARTWGVCAGCHAVAGALGQDH